MSAATDLVREVAQDILADWLDGCYFGSPSGESDWQLKLDDDGGPGQVFIERETARKYRIEMRVTRL